MSVQIQDVSQQATKVLEEKYGDVIALFDTNKFYTMLGDEIRLSGLSAETKANYTVGNLVRDTEKAFLAILDRGVLRSIQKFGTTQEAEQQIEELRENASWIPRGATRGAAPAASKVEEVRAPSRWESLTQEQYDRMPAAEARALRKSDPDFRAAEERLASAIPVKDQTSTGRVYLRRKDTQQALTGFQHGYATWGSFDLRAHMDHQTAVRYITQLRGQGIVVEPIDMGSNKVVDVSPRPTLKMKDVDLQKPAEWRLESLKIESFGPKRVVPTGAYLLKAQNNEFVVQLDEAGHLVKTSRYLGHARRFSHVESARAAAESIPNVGFWLCRHDGRQIPWS